MYGANFSNTRVGSLVTSASEGFFPKVCLAAVQQDGRAVLRLTDAEIDDALEWTPMRHRLFSEKVRVCVEGLFACPDLPDDLAAMIAQYVPTFDFC